MPTTSPAEIRAEIERTRVDVAQSIVALRHSVADAADWKRHIRQRPIGYVAGAFVLGLWLGWRSGRAATHSIA